MIVVDSSVWIDYFNGTISAATEKLDALLGAESLAVGDIILMEVLQGFRSDAQYRTARKLMTSLTVIGMLGEANAILCAEHYRDLRKRGCTVRRSTDVIIATACIRWGYPLLFQDRDFHPFAKHLGLVSVLTSP